MKNQLNFEVTFTCNFAPSCIPTWPQLGPNLPPTWPQLGPTWPPKCSKNYVKIQLPENVIFATPPIRNAYFCTSKGVHKLIKTASKTTCHTSFVPTSKRHPPSIHFGTSWLPLGPPKAPPRRFQEDSKASLKQLLEASWGILAASSIFEGVLPGSNLTKI